MLACGLSIGVVSISNGYFTNFRLPKHSLTDRSYTNKIQKNEFKKNRITNTTTSLGGSLL